MKRVGTAVVTSLAIICLLLFEVGSVSAATSSSMTVSPTAGIAGSKISISGDGYPSNTNLTIKWTSADASFVVSGNPPQVTGVNATPIERTLTSAETSSLGSFVANLTVPQDYGGQLTLQAFASNGTALPGRALFTLDASYKFSPSSGPAGTPIQVTATGLGYGEYNAYPFLYWDNSMVGYFSAISTRGTANFTFYATGSPGTHYIEIYLADQGPGYLNPTFTAQPFMTQFDLTAQPSSGGLNLSGSAVIGALAIFAAIVAAIGLFVSVGRIEPERRKAATRSLAAVLIIIAIVVAGVAGYLAIAPSSPTQSVNYTSAATVVRPAISVPQNNAASGPRISVSPVIASVGQNVTVSGAGFGPNQQVPLSWSTRKGNNLNGYKLVEESLRNATANSTGSFSFSMKAPPDLGGVHFISAGNLTRNSNGTLFLQRTASINATQGSAGTVVKITMFGVGWTFNTNIAALDYDNTYIGYGCGFSTGGNVTMYLTVTGAPGIHSIDIYPSIWWGTSNFYNQYPIEYKFPLLTPQDHPSLMPSFHFTFLITPS
ncbi:MAG: hypothetical protein OK442_03705 [Thaumarchaeota archaeon]|nr:hypothetical protein [Nitrososphaerota archaeon]